CARWGREVVIKEYFEVW
nr:immunoglobulin heavy chain junction region [Macaca mulatta]MOY18335.1 immunoglobulin heavy chain junction region [Macaca mulatta]MOY18695.1 immunoglobulin heavy chain junction region [Macaca mulatta]MOY18858.1 immunoglobulin heavy chain junction region [Macaca mulatta]MOY18908.1 immunoglobulin heavy chain junction region [Macaca mulatta]